MAVNPVQTMLFKFNLQKVLQIKFKDNRFLIINAKTKRLAHNAILYLEKCEAISSAIA